MFWEKKSKGKVFVGLSGGVDSAVSAALLQKDGWDVTGVFIRIALPGYPCSAAEDKIDAQRVAAHLRVPFIEVDLSKEYEEEVFKTSIAEFKKGRTPNPDTLCNEKIKFGSFYRFAKLQNVDFIATGHYARVSQGSTLTPGLSRSNLEETHLLTGLDPNKDQSYFLWMVPETALRYTLFPVGGLKKSEVRELAKKFGLPNAERKDSQGLCFLGNISLEDMLVRELSPVPGEVLSEEGEVIGEHDGAALYTLGQRHGFRVKSQSTESAAYFVIAKDIDFNTITVSTSRFPRDVQKTTVVLADTNWIGPAAPEGKEVMARFRYRQKLIPAQLFISKEGARVVLNKPHYVPLGQSLVLYQNERCLGGGVIAQSTLE